MNFEEILSLVHGNFDEQNKVLEPSITIINHCIIIIVIIIIINACYIYIVKLMHSIIITFIIKVSSWNAIRKCRSNWGCCCFLFDREIVKHFIQCHVFAQSPPARRPNDKYPVNTSHSSRGGFLTFYSQYYLVATVILIQSVHSDRCVCVCVYIYIYIYIFFAI